MDLIESEIVSAVKKRPPNIKIFDLFVGHRKIKIKSDVFKIL